MFDPLKYKRLPGIESGIAKVIPWADRPMEVSFHPKIALRHNRPLTSLVRVSRDVPVSRPSGRAGRKSWIGSSRGCRRARRAAAGARDGAAADGGDGQVGGCQAKPSPSSSSSSSSSPPSSSCLMEEMVELGEAEPPLLRADSYWSRDSVLAISGPSTAIPVVTELGRYLDDKTL